MRINTVHDANSIDLHSNSIPFGHLNATFNRPIQYVLPIDPPPNSMMTLPFVKHQEIHEQNDLHTYYL